MGKLVKGLFAATAFLVVLYSANLLAVASALNVSPVAIHQGFICEFDMTLNSELTYKQVIKFCKVEA